MISARTWFSHAALLAASVTGCASSTGWSPQYVTSSSSSLATHLSVDHLVASAQTHEKRGNAEKARQLYEEVLEAYPGHPVAQKQYNRIIARTQHQEAQSLERRLALAQAFEQQGQIQRAKQVYAHILKAQPDHDVAARRMELLYAQENRNRTGATRLAERVQEGSVPADESSDQTYVAAELQVQLSGEDKIEIEYKGGVERLTGIVADPTQAPKATKIVAKPDRDALEAAARRPKRVVIAPIVVDAGGATPELAHQSTDKAAPRSPATLDAVVVSSALEADRTAAPTAVAERTIRPTAAPQRDLDARVISERDSVWRPSRPDANDTALKGALAKSAQPDKSTDPHAAKWHPAASAEPVLQPAREPQPAEQPQVQIEPAAPAETSAAKKSERQSQSSRDIVSAAPPQVNIEPLRTARPAADEPPAAQWLPKSEAPQLEQPHINIDPIPAAKIADEKPSVAQPPSDPAPEPVVQAARVEQPAPTFQYEAEIAAPPVDNSTARANARELDRSLERQREEVQHAVEIGPIGPPPASESSADEASHTVQAAGTDAQSAEPRLASPAIPAADGQAAESVDKPADNDEPATRKRHEWYPETNGRPEFRALFDEPKQPAVEPVDPFNKAEIPQSAEPSAWHQRKARDINDFVDAPEKAIPEITQFLRDPEAKNRSLAACLLSQVAPRSLGALPSLQSALRSESNSMVRVYLAESIINLTPNDPLALEALIASLQDSDSRVRWLSACALGATATTQNQRAIAGLTEALRDTHPKVRSMASLSLSEFGPAAHRALPTLQDALNDREDRVREAAATAIARIGSRNTEEFTATDQAYPNR